jgi:hypothetical protein
MCAEKAVPERTRYSEITGHLRIVVACVMYLGPVQQRTAPWMPPMDDIMNEQIPEISEHQSHRRSAGYLPSEQDEQWNEPTQPEAQQA